jgi:hypothetical protein
MSYRSICIRVVCFHQYFTGSCTQSSIFNVHVIVYLKGYQCVVLHLFLSQIFFWKWKHRSGLFCICMHTALQLNYYIILQQFVVQIDFN